MKRNGDTPPRPGGMSPKNRIKKGASAP